MTHQVSIFPSITSINVRPRKIIIIVRDNWMHKY